MAVSAINIKANAQEVINLKKRIDELKASLSGMKRQDNVKLYDKLNNELQQSSIRYNRLTSEIQRYVAEQNRASQATSSSANEMLNLFAKIGGTTAIIGLGKQIMDVRNEFQQLEIAFGTMLKSTDKAATLMKDLTKFAAETPFGLQSAASGAKQLLAYGSTAETVIKELTMLGDVAAGTGQQIGDLVYLYGTLRTQGRAYLMDIRQFAGRGIPIYDELAKVLNTSKDKVNEFVSAGKVGFKEVEQAFKNMTAQGGLYGGLMEEQSKSIGGRMEALKDNISSIFNQIGKDSEGFIYKSIDGINTLVENYETVGKVLLGLVTTYGTYKTAVILAAVAESGWTVTQMAHFRALVVVEKAQKLLNATMMKNPYVLAATVLVGLVTTIWALNDGLSESEKAMQKANDAFSKGEASAISEQKELSRLRVELERTTVGSEKYNKVKQEIVDKFGKYLPELDREITKVDTLATTYDRLTIAIRKSSLARAKDDALKNISDEYKSNVEESLKNIRSVVDEINGSDEAKERLYRDIYDAVLSGNENIIDTQTINRLNSLGEKRGKANKEEYDNEVKSLSAMNRMLYKNEELYKAVVQAKKDNQKLSDEQAAINKLFPDDLGEVSKESELAGDNFKSAADKYNEAAKKYKQAKSYFDGVKANKDIYSAEEWTRAKEEYEAAKKELEEFDGKAKSDKQIESAADKAHKLAQKQADDLLKLNNDKARAALEARNIELENQQSLLNIQEDGFEKQQKQADLNHQKEILAIDKRVQDLIDKKQDAERKEWDIKNPNGSKIPFTPKTNSVADLDYNDITGIIESDIIATKNKEKATADSLRATLEEYQSYVDKYTSISTKFNKKIADLENARTPENSEQVDRSISEAKFQQNEAIKAVNDEFAQREETFKAWTNQITDLSLKQLQALLSQVEKELEVAESSGVSGVDLAVARAKVDAAKEKIKNVNSTTTPGKRTIKEWQDLEKTLKDVNSSFEEIGDTVGGTAGEILSAAGEISSSTLSMINGIVTLSNSSSTAMDTTAKAASASIQAVEKASVILAIISAALQIATKIASLFAADYSEYEKAKGVYESYIAVLDKVIEKQKELVETMTGENARNSYEYALELIKKQEAAAREIGLIFAGSGASAGSSSKGRRAWDRISEQGWNELAQWNKELSGMAYDAKNVDWLFGQSAEELQRLQEVAPTFWAQLGDDIGGYLQAIIDSGEASKELMEYYKESITQISFDSFRDSFLDTLSDMDSSSEDFADNFEKYLQTAILNGLLKEKYDSQIRDLYDNFSKYGENGIDQSEYAALQKQKDDLVNSMLAERDKMKDLFDWTSENDKLSQQSSRGGFETMSQDTATALEGRFTSMQMRLITIDENVARIAQWNQPIGDKFNFDSMAMPLGVLSQSSLRIERMIEENRNIAISSYYELKDINKQTKELYAIREGIDAIKKNTDGLI